jgi:hypothetical protein
MKVIVGVVLALLSQVRRIPGLGQLLPPPPSVPGGGTYRATIQPAPHPARLAARRLLCPAHHAEEPLGPGAGLGAGSDGGAIAVRCCTSVWS